MKFSHDWLSRYVAIKDPPELLGERLTAAGIPLEAIERHETAAIGGSGVVYDFEIFGNRPDCMNHLGLAREYAATVGEQLRPPVAAVPRGGPTSESVASIRVDAPGLCTRYSARCVLGVRVGPSPAWLRSLLESIGQRSINNVVDVTNFVLWELGHPLHPFDLDRLLDNRIIVRQAVAGETLATLDGAVHELNSDMLVIADERHPVALAGIMGGVASEIGEATVNVLLESAWFDPVSIRRTARALGMRTDASHRFERGADPEATVVALDRAAGLIAEIAGGAVTDPPIDVYPAPIPPRVVSFRPSRTGALLGMSPEIPFMRERLGRLGFGVAERYTDSWEISVPTFRTDVTCEADIIEEVARHLGYDAIPSNLPLLPDSGTPRHRIDRLADAVRRAMLAAGLSEAINYDMVEAEDCRIFTPEIEEPVALENPLQSQSSHMRSSLLPGLLRNVAHNLNHGLSGVHLFEIGSIFLPGRERLEERLHVGFVLSGCGLPVHWSLPRREVDFYDARGTAELLLDLLAISTPSFSSDRISYLAPGGSLAVASEGQPLGVMGEIARPVLHRYGIDGRVFGGHFDLAALQRAPAAERRHRALPRYPAVRRDLALIVNRQVTFDMIDRVVRASGGVPIAEVQVFDLYHGAGVPEGCVSVAIQVVFQHRERTLETEEIQAAQAAIVKELGAQLGARLRGGALD